MVTGCSNSDEAAPIATPSQNYEVSSSTPIKGGSGCFSPNGVVKWFNVAKGYGFIAQDAGGADLFFHSGDVVTSGGPLQQGQKVEFDVKPGPKGLQAANVGGC